MPPLKQLACSIELGGNNVPMKEYGTRYGDGHVETFIAVPSKEVNFSIHLTSDRYIAPGLAMFVYIDGQYQCNRNRGGLVIPEQDSPTKHYQVDFRVRQKEERRREQADGTFLARDWTFHALDTVSADSAPDVNPDFLNNLGTIEVVVLRCKADSQVSVPRPNTGSTPSVSKQTTEPVSRKQSEKGASAASSMMGGMFGLFDGVAEYEPPSAGRGYGFYGIGAQQSTLGTGGVPGFQPRNMSSGSYQPLSAYPGHEEDRFHGLPQVETLLSATDDRNGRYHPNGILKKPILDPTVEAEPVMDDYRYSRLTTDQRGELKAILRQQGVAVSESDAAHGRAEPSHHRRQNTLHTPFPHVSFAGQSVLPSHHTPDSNGNNLPVMGAQPQSTFPGIEPYNSGTPFPQPSPFTNAQQQDPVGSPLQTPPGFTSFPGLANQYAPPTYQSRPIGSTPLGMTGIYQLNAMRIPTVNYTKASGAAPTPGRAPERVHGYDSHSAPFNQHEPPHGSASPGLANAVFDPWNGYGATRSSSETSRRTLSPVGDIDFDRRHDPIDWAKPSTEDRSNGRNWEGTPSKQGSAWQAQTAHSDRSKRSSKQDQGRSRSGWDNAQKGPSHNGSNKNAWGQSETENKAGVEKSSWEDKTTNDNNWGDGPASGNEWDNKPASNRGWDDKPASNQGCNDKPASNGGWDNNPATEKSRSTSKSASQSAWNDSKQGSIKSGQNNDNWATNDQQTTGNAGGWDDDSNNNQQQHKGSSTRSKARSASVKGSTKGYNDGSNSPPKINVKPYWSQWQSPMSIIIETPEEKLAKARDPHIAPAEPLIPIAPEIAQKRKVEHQVKRGKGAAYVHLTGTPDYLDDLEHPYAVFRFKYRSRKFIEKKFKTKVLEGVRDDVKRELEGMSREQLADELLKLKMKDQSSSDKPRSEKTMSSAAKVKAWDNSAGQNSARSHRSDKAQSVAGSRKSQKKDEGGWGNVNAGQGWGGSNKGGVAPQGNW